MKSNIEEPKASAGVANLSIVAGVMALFFMSGITGLIYEVVWTRLLTYLFGATIYAISTVLTAFMGGLALGSIIFGRLADRWQLSSLKAYALLELFVGITALLLIVLLKLIEPVFGFVYLHWTNSFFLLSLVRFILCFIVLLIPTTLMGGTLPLLSRFITHHRQTLGLRIGSLYAINTFGAVVGCFVAGFYLIALLGVRGTVFFAVAINVIVAIIGLLLWEKIKGHSAGTHIPTNEEERIIINSSAPVYEYRTTKAVLWLYFFSGLISLAYQVGWWRGLVFSFEVLKNTTYAFSSMLTVFLIGLALGSALMSRYVDRQHDPLRLFGLLQILTGLAGFLSVFIMYFKGRAIAPFPALDPTGVYLRWWAAVGNIFAKTTVTIFLPTLLMGMMFPVVVRICIQSLRRVGLGVGRIYALNTFGNILGAFISGFFLIPLLGLATGVIVLAIGNVVLGCIAFLINPSFTRQTKTIFVIATGLVAVVMLIRAPTKAVLQPIYPGEKLIFYEEGKLATVAVVESPLGHRTLYVDNVGVAGTDPIMLTDQKSLAHIPMLLLPDACSALTVGFGSGGASWSYTRYDSLERIDCIEICPVVLKAAPYLLESNHGVLNLRDPRYRIIIDDVRSYLRFTDQTYDIIATDCTDLRYKTNANLYDYEYFQLCRKRLTDDGMVVVWMPLAGLMDEDFRMTLRTFYRVFPEMSVWYMNNEPTHYILLVGTKKPLKIDYLAMKKKLSEPDVKNDLWELNLDDVDKLLSCYLVGPDNLPVLIGNGKINTENHPYLEFDTPKQGYGEEPLVKNLKTLLNYRSDIFEIIKPASITEQERSRLQKFVSAVPDVINGICAYRLLELTQAAEYWLNAKKKCPEDRSVAALLEFYELRKRIDAFPFEKWSKLELGKVLIVQKRYDEAIVWFKRVVEDYDSLSPSVMNSKDYEMLRDAYNYLAQCYNALGKDREAKEFFDKAKNLNPSSAGKST